MKRERLKVKTRLYEFTGLIKDSLLPHPVPDRPWQVLAVEMFDLAQGKFVVLLNY